MPDSGRALVGHGRESAGRVAASQLLMDLEHLGVTVADGPPELVARMLTGVADQLASSGPPGLGELILVSLDDVAPATDRVTCCDDLAKALDLMTAQAVRLRRAAGAAAIPGTPPDSEGQALTVLISRIAPEPAELTLLVDLVAEPGGAAGLLAAGLPAGLRAELPARRGLYQRRGRAAVLDLGYDADQPDSIVATLGPVQARTQLAGRVNHQAFAGLFSAVAGNLGSAQGGSAQGGSAQGGSAQGGSRLLRQVPAAPALLASPAKAHEPAASLRIGVLGAFTINGQLGALLPAQSQLIIALALHGSSGLSNRQLCGLLGADPDHPKPSDSLRQLIARTRRQLGRAADGLEWIQHLGHGVYALHQDARVDWHEFDSSTSAGIQAGDAGQLASALNMIRGQPFTGCYYWWLDIELVEAVRARIVAAASTLADLRLSRHDSAAAGRAARIGLVADPTAEQLWRALMRADHEAGNLAGVREAWTRCMAAIGEIAADGQPHPATAALYRELVAR